MIAYILFSVIAMKQYNVTEVEVKKVVGLISNSLQVANPGVDGTGLQPAKQSRDNELRNH